MPADIVGLEPGQQRYTQLLNDERRHHRRPDGDALGLADDDGRLMLVVNASRKDGRLRAHRRRGCRTTCGWSPRRSARCWPCRGRRRSDVMAKLSDVAAGLRFMSASQRQGRRASTATSRARATPARTASRSRSPAAKAEDLARLLLAQEGVQPIGLGARDSLRLEAGLCLYGHDIDETTSPVEAGLVWSIQKRRRERGRLPGAARIQEELADGPARRRVGIKPDGRAPAREGTEILRAARRPRSASSPRAASARASTARSRWATSRRHTPSPARP